MTSEQFLSTVFERVEAKGHILFPWTKGRWGFSTHCKNCGMFVHVKASKRQVCEEPTVTCEEQRKLFKEPSC